ncbi:MAG: hypothetical protein ACOX5M_03105 [Bacillota bacterium]
MPIKGFRWVWVALAAAVTLAVLSLSYSSYENLGVKKPLSKALLVSSDIESVDVRRDGPLTVVEIAMKSVPDLAVSYRAAEEIVRQHIGNSPFRMEIRDSRTPELEEAYHAIHFYVEEASVRGTFGAMIEESSNILREAGFSEYKLSVDKDRIYVRIANSGGYLYEVIERVLTEGGLGA